MDELWDPFFPNRDVDPGRGAQSTHLWLKKTEKLFWRMDVEARNPNSPKNTLFWGRYLHKGQKMRHGKKWDSRANTRGGALLHVFAILDFFGGTFGVRGKVFANKSVVPLGGSVGWVRP